ncbi:MAG: M20/M25/M40 family metallo-hydrolase [Candidatus Omnitrophota bacterium]
MDKQRIIGDIKKIITKHKIGFRIKVLACQDPIEIDKNLFHLKILSSVLKKNRINPILKPSFGATVINFLKDKGIDAFAFGFGSKGCAHAKNEYVKIKNLIKGVNILEDYVKELDFRLN